MSDLPRLLIADDDDGTRSLLANFFSKKGFAVVAVENGTLASAALRAGDIDVALLDVMMPGMSGLQVVEEARDAGVTTPVIIATVRGASEAVVHALSAGADDYVTKPFDLAILHARVLVRLRQSKRPRASTMPSSASMLPTSVVSPASPPSSSSSPLPSSSSSSSSSAPERFVTGAGVVLDGRYELLKEIGRGSFGVVWRARHRGLESDVAVKLLNVEHAKDGTPRLDDRATPRVDRTSRSDELRLEGVRAARVQHPHAVRVYDVGTVGDGTPYLVMELLDGPTVEDVIRQQRVQPISRTVGILVPVLEALAAAHAEGVIHRDVKPANVLLHRSLTGEVVKVLDFGVAKLVTGGGDLPAGHLGSGSGEGSSRVIAGSPAYLAPERLRGNGYDGRADVYAVGVMLYELLTGRVPFFSVDGDLMKVALMHLKDQPELPSERNPDLPVGLDPLILTLLAKDPARRPTAVQAISLVKDLLDFV